MWWVKRGYLSDCNEEEHLICWLNILYTYVYCPDAALDQTVRQRHSKCNTGLCQLTKHRQWARMTTSRLYETRKLYIFERQLTCDRLCWKCNAASSQNRATDPSCRCQVLPRRGVKSACSHSVVSIILSQSQIHRPAAAVWLGTDREGISESIERRTTAHCWFFTFLYVLLTIRNAE